MMNRFYNLIYSIKFIWISLIIVFTFSFLPLIHLAYKSLFKGRGNDLTFSGLDNYISIINDEIVVKAIFNTMLLFVTVIPIVLGTSYFLAISINKIKTGKIRRVITAILFFPSITSPVAYSFFFKRFFAMDGYLTHILTEIKIINEPFHLLLTEVGARIAIAIVCVWAWTGFYTLLFSVSIQNFSKSLFKTAIMDGANERQITFKVIFPCLRPIIFMSAILLSNSILQLFTEVSIISQGGPQMSTITLSYYIYQICFKFVPEFGYASAIGIILFILSALISIPQFKIGEL